MAASTAFAVVVPASLELSSLSSIKTFGSSSLVQVAPVARPAGNLKATKLVAARASSSSEEQKTARREVLASILAAGVALSFSGQASAANPIATAKSKASQAVQGAKNLAGSNPASVVGDKADEVVKGAKNIAGSNPLENLTGSNPLGEVQNAADNAGSEIKRRIDGIWGKNKPYPARNVTSSGKGAVADAKARVGDFLNKSQNPIATNVEKAAKETEAGLGSATGENSGSARAAKELLGQDSTRVDEATRKVGAITDKLQNKALQAFDDAKSVAGDVTNAAPEVKAPGTGLFKSLGNKLEGVKGDVASKAEEAKNAAGSAASGVTSGLQ